MHGSDSSYNRLHVKQLNGVPLISLIDFVGHVLMHSSFPSQLLVDKNIYKTPYLLLANISLPTKIPIKADKNAVETGKSV